MTTSLSDTGVTFADNSVQARAVFPVPVRQTVLSGPVDTNGFSAFGGSTGSTTVTASGTLRATAANGFDSLGQLDYEGAIVNPSWTGLSTNGTMYLYLDIAQNGTCTTGSTTLQPNYQWGGTRSTVNGQATYNIQESSMTVGNGSVATQTYRVFVGEVTVAGAVVTAITWYALQGRYDSGYTTTLPSAGVNTSKNHNIGTVPYFAAMELRCVTTEGNYAVGDVVSNFYLNGTNYMPAPISKTALVVQLTAQSSAGSSFGGVFNKTTGVLNVLTNANWAYRFTANRGW